MPEWGTQLKTVFLGLGFAVFCANLGFLAAYTFLPLYTLRLGANMAEVGMLLAVYSVVSTIMMVVLGRISDIGGLRRVLIILGLSGSTTVYWLLGASRSYTQLLLLWGLLGVTDSAYRPAAVAVIAEITPGKKVGRDIGIFNAFISAGMAAGCLVGGVIADLSGLAFVFTAASLVLLMGVVSSLVALVFSGSTVAAGSSSRVMKKEGTGLISSRYLVTSGLLLLCVDVFLRNSGFRGVTTFLPVYLAGLGAENSLTGTIIAVNFASQVAFMPMMGWLSDKVGRKHVLSIGMLATLAATFTLSMINNPIDVIPIELAVAFSWAAITVASNAFAADVAPPERLGEAMGVVLTSMNLGGVVGPVAAGFISHRFDLRTTFQALTIFPLLGFLFSLRLKSPGKSVKHKAEVEVARETDL